MPPRVNNVVASPPILTVPTIPAPLAAVPDPIPASDIAPVSVVSVALIATLPNAPLLPAPINPVIDTAPPPEVIVSALVWPFVPLRVPVIVISPSVVAPTSVTRLIVPSFAKTTGPVKVISG